MICNCEKLAFVVYFVHIGAESFKYEVVFDFFLSACFFTIFLEEYLELERFRKNFSNQQNATSENILSNCVVHDIVQNHPSWVGGPERLRDFFWQSFLLLMCFGKDQ